MNRLHLYIGEGKGKTTAAMGLALRALGHGWRVLVAQFLKDGRSGERTALAGLQGAMVVPIKPVTGFVFRMDDDQRAQTAQEQTKAACELSALVRAKHPELIVLDELAIATDMGIVSDEAARHLIDAALESGETVVTGRRAPDWLVNRADYLSRIEALRHPFHTEGLAAREGIEW